MEERMLKKEFRDTIRILLESSVLLLAIPFMMAISLLGEIYISYYELIYYVSVFTILAFACYSGLAMFRTERKDKGFEYLLTLPFSKRKIFLYKWLPRFLVLAVLALVSALVFKMTFSHWVIPMLLVQLGAVFLSLAFPSLFAGFAAVLVLGWFYALANVFVTFHFYTRWGVLVDHESHLIAMLLLVIPLGVSFFLAFRNFDLKPFKVTVRSYFYVAVPVILLEAVFIFMNFEKFRRFL
jgi:hypothetical protein